MSTKKDYAALLYRAKWESLTTTEQDIIAHELQSHSSDADPYTLIHILGRSGAFQHRALVEKYLESSDDPSLAWIALHALCNCWGLEDYYLDQLTRFVRGVEWDEGYVQSKAVSIVGNYLAEHTHPELLRLLIHLADTTSKAVLQETVIEALARALGATWSEIINKPPSAEDALKRAKARLVQEEG